MQNKFHCITNDSIKLYPILSYPILSYPIPIEIALPVPLFCFSIPLMALPILLSSRFVPPKPCSFNSYQRFRFRFPNCSGNTESESKRMKIKM